MTWLRHTHHGQSCDGHEGDLARIGKWSAADVAGAHASLRDVAASLHRHIKRINNGPRMIQPSNTTAILRAAKAAEAEAGRSADALRRLAPRSADDHAEILYDLGHAAQDMERVVHDLAMWMEDAARRTAETVKDRELARAAPRLGNVMGTTARLHLRRARRRIQDMPLASHTTAHQRGTHRLGDTCTHST